MHKRIIIAAFMAFASGSIFAEISFHAIRNNMNRMTDVQFKEYTKSLVGKKVTWVGWVDESKEKLFGGYECWIDMDSPKEMSVQDVTFSINKKVALKLQKDKRVQFTGKIKSINDILGSCQVTLESARILRMEQ